MAAAMSGEISQRQYRVCRRRKSTTKIYRILTPPRQCVVTNWCVLASPHPARHDNNRRYDERSTRGWSLHATAEYFAGRKYGQHLSRHSARQEISPRPGRLSAAGSFAFEEVMIRHVTVARYAKAIIYVDLSEAKRSHVDIGMALCRVSAPAASTYLHHI